MTTSEGPKKFTKTTLFVRGLPESVEDASLLAYFSQFGAVRAAFKLPQKTFGFVHFALAEDATACMAKLKDIPLLDASTGKPAKLKAEIALRKHEKFDPTTMKLAAKPTEVKKKAVVSKVISISFEPILKDLTEKQLYKKCRKFGNVVKTTIEPDCAIVAFTTVHEASEAVKRLNGHVFKGSKMTVIAKDNGEEAAENIKQHRLIIRNIAFGTTERMLRDLLVPFGRVVELTLPKKLGDEKKIRGFAFVQFQTKEAADKAMQELNEHEFRKRTLAVDWAVSKDAYVSESKQDDSKEEPQKQDELKIHDGSDGDEAENEEPEEEPEKVVEENVPELERTIFLRNVPFDASEEDLEEACGEHFGIPVKTVKIVRDAKTKQPKGTAFVIFAKRVSITKKMANTSSLIDADMPTETSNTWADNVIMLSGRAMFAFPAESKEQVKERSRGEGDLEVKDKRHLYLIKESLLRPKAPAFHQFTEEDVKMREEDSKLRTKTVQKDLSVCVSDVRVRVSHLPARVDEQQLKKVFTKAIDEAKAFVKAGGKPLLLDDMNAKKLLTLPLQFKQVKVVRATERDIATQRTALEENKYSKKATEDLKKNAVRLNRSRGFAFVQFVHPLHALVAVRWLNNWSTDLTATWQAAQIEPNVKSGKQQHTWPVVEFATEKVGVLERQQKLLAQKQLAKPVSGEVKKKKKKKFFF